MDKEEFKIQLLEQQIFDELKDGYFGGIGYIITKYEGSGIDYSRVYRRIINYRIKAFGTSTVFFNDYYTRQERIKQNDSIRKSRRRSLR